MTVRTYDNEIYSIESHSENFLNKFKKCLKNKYKM